MADIEQRLAKAARFLDSARNLRRRDPETAVSRAYYAVYHCCVALLLARLYVSDDDESVRALDHRQILGDSVRYFGAAMDARRVRRQYGAAFAESLRASIDARSHADYGLGQIDEADARIEIAFAGRVLEATWEVLAHDGTTTGPSRGAGAAGRSSTDRVDRR